MNESNNSIVDETENTISESQIHPLSQQFESSRSQYQNLSDIQQPVINDKYKKRKKKKDKKKGKGKEKEGEEEDGDNLSEEYEEDGLKIVFAKKEKPKNDKKKKIKKRKSKKVKIKLEKNSGEDEVVIPSSSTLNENLRKYDGEYEGDDNEDEDEEVDKRNYDGIFSSDDDEQKKHHHHKHHHHRSRSSSSNESDSSSSDSDNFEYVDRPKTLEQKKNAINFLLGFKPWKGHITKRPTSLRSERVKSLFDPISGKGSVIRKTTGRTIKQKKNSSLMINFGNILYLILFGWWVCLSYFLIGLLCFCSIICFQHGKLCLKLGIYYLWPFNKYIEKVFPTNSPVLVKTKSKKKQEEQEKKGLLNDNNNMETETGNIETSTMFEQKENNYNEENEQELIENNPEGDEEYIVERKKLTIFDWVEHIIFIVLFSPFLILIHLFVSIVSWFLVLFIPTSKLHMHAIVLLFHFKQRLKVTHQLLPSPSSYILSCTYNGFNAFYYKYNVFGMNIILLNMFPIVLISIFFGYAFGEEFVERYSIILFPMCLVSTVPLAYYIGQAVSSISAQTNFAIGAVLNATFGSIIELLLYGIALTKGLSNVVKGAVTGSLLGTMLLMPGISQVFGGFKYKSMRFNKNAAGVSSLLLLIAIVGAFAPTLFYQVYGSYDLNCLHCTNSTKIMVHQTKDGNKTIETMHLKNLDCAGCQYKEKDWETDPVYLKKVRPLMFICSIILPLAYCSGLIFTLKTHKHLYDEPVADDEEGKHGGHEQVAEWSKTKCIIILIVSTILFALVAECLCTSLTPALNTIHLSQDFAALTLIALIPNFAEFVNAIQFALQNNITLSLEIGNVAALQISLLQIPVLVFFSAIFFHDSSGTFTMIFNTIDVAAILFGVIILNYLSNDGRCNYFQGLCLCFVYLVIVACFFFKTNDFFFPI